MAELEREDGQSKRRDGLAAGRSSSATVLVDDLSKGDRRWKTWWPRPGDLPPSLIVSTRCTEPEPPAFNDLVEWEVVADSTGRMRRETGTLLKVRDDGSLEVRTLAIDEDGRASVGTTIVSAHLVKVLQRAKDRMFR